MKVLNFIKEWTLPCAMVLGAGVLMGVLNGPELLGE